MKNKEQPAKNQEIQGLNFLYSIVCSIDFLIRLRGRMLLLCSVHCLLLLPFQFRLRAFPSRSNALVLGWEGGDVLGGQHCAKAGGPPSNRPMGQKLPAVGVGA